MQIDPLALFLLTLHVTMALAATVCARDTPILSRTHLMMPHFVDTENRRVSVTGGSGRPITLEDLSKCDRRNPRAKKYPTKAHANARALIATRLGMSAQLCWDYFNTATYSVAIIHTLMLTIWFLYPSIFITHKIVFRKC